MSVSWLVPEVATLALEATRISGLVLAAPLAWSVAPSQVKIGLILAVAFAVHGIHPPATVETDLGPLLATVPTELLVGLAMGLMVRFAMAAVQIAADAFSPMLGFGVASLFDPHADVSETPLTQLLRNLTVLLSLILGLHRVALGAVMESFRILPVGAMMRPAAVTEALVVASRAALVSGLRLAMPIMAVLLATQVALAFISRAAPAMQIFSVGFAVTLVSGGAVLALALPDMATAIVEELSHVGPGLDHMLFDLAEG